MENKYYIEDGDRIIANDVDLEAEDHNEFGINFSPATDGTFLENAEFYYYNPEDDGLYEIKFDNDDKPYVDYGK